MQKGQRISLEKEAEKKLNKVFMGLGWDVATEGKEIDPDASCAMYYADKNLLDVVYFGHLKSKDGSIVHSGDNLTGEGEGDDEAINVDLFKVPADVDKLAIAVTIHEADTRKQNFGQVSNAFIRVVNRENGKEVARYDLSEDASTNTAMIFGELYRNGNDWKFRAVGQGFDGGLGPLARNFGVNV